jgi:hypothetical protein
VPIRPLLDSLAFTRDNPNWGYQLRLGLFEIEAEDMELIRHVATAQRPLLLA